jgi:hypothetical protein
MAALVTDQFRIFNAGNFVNSIADPSNSYYLFVGLPNPDIVGFGRTSDWDVNTPSPIDSFNNLNHNKSTILFGKKLTSENVRRVIRRIDWVRGTKYEMYRHDYNIFNQTPISQSPRLYAANYYVINSDYKVYICISNGSSGITTGGNASQDEPTFTDLEPSPAGESGDGYLWKYLFSVSPSDIVKFDSTEYITVPNDWESTTDPQISLVRDNGDSSINQNQIKKVYLDSPGFGYAGGEAQKFNIYGDGTGGSVILDVDSLGQIGNVRVASGGKDYSYGIVDLSTINASATKSARLIPIIPPSKGHGYDIYQELGTDKVLVYARFDNSTKDFPVDTKFAQVGIIKNPVSFGSTFVYTSNDFSGTYSLKLDKNSVTGTVQVGDVIRQTVFQGGGFAIGTAFGYVASYDVETGVLKYIQDRNLYFNPTLNDQTDWKEFSTNSNVLEFESTTNTITTPGGFSGTIDIGYSGITTALSTGKIVNLSVQFDKGLANPEINKTSGDIIYLDNRPIVSRNSRQKEDIKIILEF